MTDTNLLSATQSVLRPLARLSGRFALPPRGTYRGVFYRMIQEGAFGSVFTVVTGGGLLIGLAQYLHASNWQISLLNAMSFLVMPFQSILGVRFNTSAQRKRLVILSALLGRLLWLVPISLAIWRPDHAIWWLMISVFLLNVALTISILGWYSWVGELITVDWRGRFFGARMRAMSFANVLTFLIVGSALDYFRANGQEGAGHAWVGIGAILAGLASIALMQTIPRFLRKPVHVETHLSGSWKDPWHDAEFRRIMLGFGAWFMAVGFAGPYWAVHMLTYLNFGYTWLTAYGAGFTITMAIVSPFAGRWVDKYGDFKVATAGMICLSTVPIYWLFISKTIWYPVILEVAVTAFGWAAVQLTASTLPLRFSTEQNRNRYLSMMAAMTGIGFTIGSIVGGVLMDRWHMLTGVLFGMPIYSTHLFFALTGILRWIVARYFSSISRHYALQTATS